MTGCGKSVDARGNVSTGMAWRTAYFVCGVEGLCPACAEKLKARVLELEAALREEQDETARLNADRRACLDCEHASVTDEERLKKLEGENERLRAALDFAVKHLKDRGHTEMCLHAQRYYGKECICGLSRVLRGEG